MPELTPAQYAAAARVAALFEKSPLSCNLALLALAQGPLTADEVRLRALRKGPTNAAAMALAKLAAGGLVIGFGPEGPDCVYALSASGLGEVEAHFAGLAEAARKQREERGRRQGKGAGR